MLKHQEMEEKRAAVSLIVLNLQKLVLHTYVYTLQQIDDIHLCTFKNTDLKEMKTETKRLSTALSHKYS